MSDRGIPKSYRHMHGFGSHTFSMINAQNERFWVKFHLESQQGVENLSDAEAELMVGQCRESHQRDLFDSIENSEFPSWKMFIQVMPEAEAATCPYNPFDLTKVWFHKDYPLIEVGKMELNRNPENYFAEVEQSAFNPASVVSGIGFSPDKMLQGWLFSYGDAQRYRLGVNHQQIPVNAPRCPVHNYHRDGAMRVDDDYFSQPGKLFRLMTPEQQEALFQNTARAMGDAPRKIKNRHIGNCAQADPAYGAGVAGALGIPMDEVL